MFPYWFLFAFFALGATLFRSAPPQPAPLSAAAAAPVRPQPHRSAMLLLGALLIALLVGLRYRVGADWETYEFYFRWASYASLGRVLQLSDPAYQFLNWSVQHLGGEMWGVNLLCGLIFSWGLWRFARLQPEPWLAVLVAVPYLIVVVAMGYSRQAVAIGILLAGLAALGRGASVVKFALYVGFAALFHRTAIVVLPLVIFAGERNRLLNFLAGGALFLLLYDALLAESVDTLVKNYIVAEYHSQGAAIRVGMSLLPALLFLAAPKRFGFPLEEERLWRMFSYAAIGFLLLLLVLPSSTVVDRLALYIFPLQLAVLARLPLALASEGLGRLLVIAYAFLVQFVWLNFAAHAAYWVPYRLFPM
uniref:EpsG family protein n=1 Tax=uncultured Sphingomonas sp. TaxID=158754 RepID=UPI0025CC61E6|nr:EpsG family protein [uncultured Sphingomonas sp.]